MDSIKTRSNLTKLNSKTSNATKQKNQENKYTEQERKAIGELKLLYLETIKLDVDMQREIYEMEKGFEDKHNKIFEQRSKIIEYFKNFKKTSPGDEAGAGNINSFWLKVLKASYTEFISKKDEQILTHLTDIRTKLYNEPIVRFIIEFFFEPNPYFSNRMLHKTYFLNCLPDLDEPLTYDGAEIFKCEGCQIDWKLKEKEKEKKEIESMKSKFSVYSSFFDFFNPPTLPDNTEDPTYGDINAILQNDFELGFYLKERVIPKAILFYTGEIADCQSSESESDGDTDEEDDDDDDDDDDNDDDDDGSSANTPDE